MASGFWAARRPGWVAGGFALALVALTIWLLRDKSGGNTATILSLTVSIAALGIAVLGLRPAPSLSDTARDLAGRVAQERGRARRQALGMSGDARPAEMTFRPPLPDEDLVRWRSDGGADHGSLSDVAAYYRSLQRGRLVVLGEPGAGKTVLATQLVIDLAGALPEGQLEPGARPQVPVWLSLPSLDLGAPAALARLSAEDLAVRFDDLVAAQVSKDYEISRPAAWRLVRERWVLPVLDGLDEMDSPAAGGVDSRPLAAAVVRALNAGTGTRPVVLVCRHAEYGQLARSSNRRGEDPVLQDATQIVLQPLNVAAVRDFLARRFPGQQAGQPDVRWDGVWHAIQDPSVASAASAASAACTGEDPGLAEALSSPWQLFLATAAYQDPDTDPGELTRVPVAAIGEHLLARLIPAVADSTPRPDGEFYPAQDTCTWLGALARQLDRNSEQLGWSAIDLRLEQLWPIGGQQAVKRLSALATTLIIGTAFAGVGVTWAVENGHWYPNNARNWVGFASLVSFGIGFCLVLTRRTDPPPLRLEWRISSPAFRRRLMAGLTVGPAAGLVLGWIIGLAYSLPLGLAAGLTAGLALGLAFALQGRFSLADKPTSVMRQNATYALTAAPTFAIVLGLASGLATGVASGLAFGLAVGLASGLIGGLLIGLDIWIRYLIGCSLARRRGLLPRRVGRFLDWAYTANLLRMSGTAIQFRHRQLQTWLTTDPRQ